MPVGGSKGLRREEAALLAGISIEYYTRLERGTATGVSESVIDGITHALQLDEAERAHLVDLLRTASPAPPRRRPTRQQVRPTVQRVLDSIIGTPAFVLNGRLDILGANALGLALFAPIYADPIRPPNNARYLSLFVQSKGALRKELTRFLRTGRANRRPLGHSVMNGQGQLRGTVNISERPAEANDRAVPGHWEGDLIFGKAMSAIATLVDARPGS